MAKTTGTDVKDETESPESPEPEVSEDAGKPPAKDGPRVRRGLDPVRTTAIALAAIAAVAAGWSGWSWYATAHDDSHRYAQTRDEVLQSGEQAIKNLNTLDYRTLSQSLKAWQDSSTSDLYRDIVQGRAQFEQQAQKAKTITGAKVLEAAVIELDTHSGKARVIVAIEITVTPPTGQPAIKKSRIIGELTRTASGWKLSALGHAPVGNAGS